MISGTSGQEVGVYCDAIEMYATRGGAAGLASELRTRCSTPDEVNQQEDEDGERNCGYPCHPNLNLCLRGISNASESESASSSVVNFCRGFRTTDRCRGCR